MTTIENDNKMPESEMNANDQEVQDIAEVQMNDENANLVEQLSDSEIIVNNTPEESVNGGIDIPEYSENFAYILKQLSEVNEKIESMSSQFLERIKYTDYEKKVRDDMHKELQDFKGDFYAKLFLPLFKDIISIRKDILKIARIYQSKPDEEQLIPLEKYLYCAEDLADLLEKYGIIVIHSEPESLFNPRIQTVSERILTMDETLNKTIVTSVSDGYKMDERVLVYERVKVYVYEKPMDEISVPEKEGDTMI